MAPAILWYRRDLRVHDLPALQAAIESGGDDGVIPVFCFDDRLIHGRFASARRTGYLLETLKALDERWHDLGGRLWWRHGDPSKELAKIVDDTGATEVHATEDVTAFARARDDRASNAIEAAGATLHLHPGLAIAADLDAIQTQGGKPHIVFTPFSKVWAQQERRQLIKAPTSLHTPRGNRGDLPTLADLGFDAADAKVEDPPEPGEIAGVHHAGQWADGKLASGGLAKYEDLRSDLPSQTSRLSTYLHYGSLSPLLAERLVLDAGGPGSATFRNELAWRDFYLNVQRQFPHTATTEFQEKYRALKWEHDDEALQAWKDGKTGYPVVDAAMRQLNATGFMHNRARMVVASFLTKDLHLNWREGEAYFMHQLLDGDLASNNGGWQWTASTGTDPAPYFRRMFNPTLQQKKFDPKGEYVRRWCPELAGVPDKLLPEPWKMTPEQQADAGCVIGDDYPEPIVDHAEERGHAVERYQAVSAG
ncbi:MAG: deoxyribodipyrimidine photo-lyase [Solirubrobacteraceae bacterium]|nr:deoxyribodipyrimidine photo-lyase [Solirubrobacteraceae bacterium]